MDGPNALMEVFSKVLSDATDEELDKIEIEIPPRTDRVIPGFPPTCDRTTFRPLFKRSRPQMHEPPTRDCVVDTINHFFDKRLCEGITLEAADDLVDVVVSEAAEKCCDLDYEEREFILQRFTELCREYRKKASALQEVLEGTKMKHANPGAGLQPVRYKVTYNAVKRMVVEYCNTNYPGLFLEGTMNDITAKSFQIFKVMTFESMEVFQSMTHRVISDVTDKIAVVVQAKMKGVPIKIEPDAHDANFVHVKVPSEHMKGLIKSCKEGNINFVEVTGNSTSVKCKSTEVPGTKSKSKVNIPLNVGIIQTFKKEYFVIPENRDVSEYFMLRNLEQATIAKVWETKEPDPILRFNRWGFREVGETISYALFNYMQNALLYRMGYLMTKCRTDVIAKMETGQLRRITMSKVQLEKSLDKCWEDFCDNIQVMISNEDSFPVKVHGLRGKYSHMIQLDTTGLFDDLVIKTFKKISVLSYGLFVDEGAFLELRSQFMKHISQALSAHLMNLFDVTDLVVQSKMIRNTGVLKQFSPLFRVFNSLADGGYTHKQYCLKRNKFTTWRMNALETTRDGLSSQKEWLAISRVCQEYRQKTLFKIFFFWHAFYVCKTQPENANKNRAFRGLRKMTVGLRTINPKFIQWKLEYCAISAWKSVTEQGRRVKTWSRAKRISQVVDVLHAWRGFSLVQRRKVQVVNDKNRRLVQIFFSSLKSDAENTRHCMMTVRAFVTVGLYRRTFQAWDEVFLGSCVERSRLLQGAQAQCEKFKKQLANAEVRAGSSVKERDAARKSLGLAEAKVRAVEADKVKLEERLAKTQDKLVQSENLSARRLTRSVQAEARVKRLLDSPETKAVVEPEGSLADSLQCPITMQLPVDPVIADDNFTYDRAAIESHFARRGAVSPMTNAPLQSTRVRSNTMVRQVLAMMFPEHRLAPVGR